MVLKTVVCTESKTFGSVTGISMRNFIWICLTNRLLRCKSVSFFFFFLEADTSRSYLSRVSPRESAVHLVKVIVEWRTVEIGRLAKYICQTAVLVRAENWCYPLGLIAVWPEDWTQEDKEAHTIAAKARSVSHTRTHGHTGAYEHGPVHAGPLWRMYMLAQSQSITVWWAYK